MKLDPRVDPYSEPPTSRDDFSVDRVVVPHLARPPAVHPSAIQPGAEASAQRAEPASDARAIHAEPRRDAPPRTATALPDLERDAEPEPLVLASSVVPIAEPTRRSARVTSQDPRYAPVEKLLDSNDWRQIGEDLGPIDKVGALPPNLGLVAALAHNENAPDGDPEAAAVAIRCMAGLLGVEEDSPIARVLARRMLRKNPVRLRDRRAPPARISGIIVVVTLLLGGSVGWVASMGSWHSIARMLHLM